MKKYIIIAEDDEDDQFLISSAWEEFDTDVTYKFVNDGVALLQMLQTAEAMPEFLIMDLNMPIKNGREVLMELRNSDIYKYIPVLIMSTSKAPYDIASSYDAGANAYLVKPSTFTELENLLKNVLAFWIDTAEKLKT